MEKIKFLYHGSPKKLIGEKLIPNKPNDLGNRKDNLNSGVYATDLKESAIAMAIISSEGVHSAGLNFAQSKNCKGIIYKGWPTQEEIYLCILNPKEFVQTGKIKHQFLCQNPVKPLNIEKILIKDYLYLIRNATDKEKERWIKKYGEL